MLSLRSVRVSWIICLQGFTALHIAINQDDRASAEFLLRHGADAYRPANDASLLLTAVHNVPPAQQHLFQQEVQVHDWDHIKR